MVFKVYKRIKKIIKGFNYHGTGFISFLVIKKIQKMIKRKEKEITKKIIDFIKYK